MRDEFEVILGSGNVYRDLNYPDADLRQAKALLASDVIGIVNNRKLTSKKAAKLTGIETNVFDRIRKPDLKCFTLDRLITILNKLDQHVDICIHVTERTHEQKPMPMLG